ncbi:MAG: DUF192 domain-containing protein [Candidatus Wallbacteria bacterium]|nr:DUF192 domain-containing protein [Candidatus Wallbacteria bacterium]
MESRKLRTDSRLRFFLVLSAVVCVTSAFAAGRITGAIVRGHRLDLEVVSTLDAMRTGLMFREKLDPDAGMLFAYPVTQPLTFWMKNTRLPLSIAFLDSEGVVLNIEDMAPFDDKTMHHSKGAAKYAIEVNRGWFQKRAIVSGDRVQFLKTVDSEPSGGGTSAP